EHGNKLALKVAGYFDESPVQFTWRGRYAYEFTTASHHVPFSRWFGWLREAGLDVEVIEEPKPTPEAIEHRPALADAAIVGYFMLFSARKPGPGRP
ncbi:MAG: hypothetical protein V3S18_06430, partial [Dehalococcoidia bacterium]